MALNGLAILVNREDQKVLETLPEFKAAFPAMMFEAPTAFQADQSKKALNDILLRASSTEFIGAKKLNDDGIRGSGIRIGVVDTGIDYTHKMMGGEGDVAKYEQNDPSVLEAGTFPNGKVVGGYDFTGDQLAVIGKTTIPQPDLDPLDFNGHGTHVAGTIAGIGDGLNSYDGVAPDASLYALKVFPRDGGAPDYALLAAFDYAADPDGNLDPSDRLDVLNLSLGSDWGVRYDRPYPRALKNLEQSGMVVVMAAGNSGNIPFIVGSPSSLYEGQLSVAASTDDDEVNYVQPGAQVIGQEDSQLIEIRWASSVTKPETMKPLIGPMIYVGLALEPFSTELKAKIKGKIALIDRGQGPFLDKAKKAIEAGSIGIVFGDNKDNGALFSPNTDSLSEDFPIAFIGKKESEKIKAALTKFLESHGTENSQEIMPIMFQFDPGIQFKKPELIDQVTDFSSRGPRLGDGIIKPQITAPGANILSAQAGSGQLAVRFSGTSMASPHIAGVMALLKQSHPEESVTELNARLMNTAQILSRSKLVEDVARQGAGRVRADLANSAQTLVFPPSLSLGFMNTSDLASFERTIIVKNLKNSEMVYWIESKAKNGAMTVSLPTSIRVAKKSEKSFVVRFQAHLSELTELDGFILMKDSDGQILASIPYLGMIHAKSQVKAHFNPIAQETTFSNTSEVDLEYLTGFRRLGLSKDDHKLSPIGSKIACDLRTAAVRKIETLDSSAARTTALQFAISVNEKHETWNICETSIQIDIDGDQKPDLEALGVSDLSEFTEKQELRNQPGSVLLDFTKAQDITIANQKLKSKDQQSLEDSVISMIVEKPFSMSSLRLITIPWAVIQEIAHKKSKNNMISLKASSSYIDFDDFASKGQWIRLDLSQLKEISSDRTFLRPKEIIKLKRSSQMDIIYFPHATVQRGFVVGGGIESVILN